MDDLIKFLVELSNENKAQFSRFLREEGAKFNVFPLSFAQQRLWFLDQLEPGRPTYNLASAIRLSGQLAIPALKQSLDAMIGRHESLRTTFVDIEGQPIQVVQPQARAYLPVIDLQNLAEREREEHMHWLIKSEARHPFDLAQGPLFRTVLLKLAETHHVLLLNMHHIISDGWSFIIFIRELVQFYEAFAGEKALSLPDLSIQYADYAVWERKRLQGKELERLLAYWKQTLNKASSVLEIPTDFPRPPIQAFRGAYQPIKVSASVMQALVALSRQENVTLFMTLLAAFNILLYRYTAQTDVIVGSPIANRNRSEVEDVIGFFVNTLVLRVDLSGNPTFLELLARVQQVATEAYTYQDLPFEKLVEELQLERNPSHTPLFQVMFALQNFSIPSLEIPGLHLQPIQFDSGVAHFDLTVDLGQWPDGLRGKFEYNTDLFKADTVARMVEQFNTLLQSIVADPGRRLSALSILPEQESKQLMKWNDTKTDYPRQVCIHELFEGWVERTPDAVAIICQERLLTYKALNQRANQLAHHLRSLGIGPEVHVGIYLQRSLDMIVALLGVLKAGGVYVPLDSSWPVERVEWILSSLEVGCLLTYSSRLRAVHDFQWRLANLTAVICLDVDTPVPPAEPLNPAALQTLWDHVAEQATDRATAAGFISSYTGNPFPEVEVDQYRDHVVQLAQPYLSTDKRVLEIGCGSGLIMFALAPSVKHYTGLDASAATQEMNRAYIAENNHTNIELLTNFAHEIGAMPPNSYDLIILASTAQFFPGPFYFRQVIKKALKLLTSGGVILVADVMDARQKEAFRESLVAFEHEHRHQSNIKTKTHLESELYFDENYFYDLQAEFAQISDIQVCHRTGGFKNELRYRYDVIIQTENGASLPQLHRRKKLRTSWHLRQLPQNNLPAVIEPHNTAYNIFTSGSTGVPKGVVVRHRPVVNLIDWVNNTFEIGPDDRVLFVTSLCFDLSVYDIFGLLAAGGSIQVATESNIQEPQKLLQMLCDGAITFWDSAPAMLQQLAPFFLSTQANTNKSRLRLIFLSGDWIPLTLPDQARSAFSKAKVISLGGATEATVWSNYYPVEEIEPHWVSIPYGRPIQNAQYYMLDRYLNLCPIGVPGDLYIGGECLASGYANAPTLTAASFIPDPFSDKPGSYLYKTGDLARYWADGNMEFLGRTDHQVKVRGFRIELGEIEVTLQHHPAVQKAVVIARKTDHGDRRLVACIIKEQDYALANQDLRRFLKGKLPDYMVPATFVFLENLPLTSNGKVDRKALAEISQVQPDIETNYVAPRTPTEEWLVDLWADILELSQVGTHDNFFELGGHSLLATQVVSQTRETFQVELPLRQLFEFPTISGFATCIDTARQMRADLQAPPIRSIARNDDMPLSFAQQRIWFLDRLEPGSPFYNIPTALRLCGQLDIDVLQQSLNKIIERHEVLRTAFPAQDGRPLQIIAPRLRLLLPVLDLREVAKTVREMEVQRLVSKEAQQPFNLAEAPLLRVTLLWLDNEEYVLLLTIHHIVSDGWSASIFAQELVTLYQHLLTGSETDLSLPQLPIQYADFAYWQRQWLQGEVLQKQFAYWQQKLDGIPAHVTLPTDRPRPPVQTFQGGFQSVTLPESLIDKLRDVSRHNRATLFMTMLATFMTLIHRYTGQNDIVVGSPIANRNRAEVEGLIGFFANTLVLRTDFSGDPTFRKLLQRVRETTLEAYAHQDLPFEQLVDFLKPERDPGYTPLFQILFLFQNTPPVSLSLPELSVTHLQAGSHTAKFDLSMSIVTAENEFIAGLEYNTDLFDAETITQLLNHYQNLLESIVANPEQRSSELSLLSEAERHRLLGQWR